MAFKSMRDLLAATAPTWTSGHFADRAGVHIHVVQEVLGHTRVTTTERYTHAATLQMRDASERISQALWDQG